MLAVEPSNNDAGGFPMGTRRVARAVHDTDGTRSAFTQEKRENARIGSHQAMRTVAAGQLFGEDLPEKFQPDYGRPFTRCGGRGTCATRLKVDREAGLGRLVAIQATIPVEFSTAPVAKPTVNSATWTRAEEAKPCIVRGC